MTGQNLSKGIMIIFKTKCPYIRCIPDGSLGLQKNMLVDKNLSKGINKFQKPKGPQTCCIPHGRLGLAQFLDQLPLKTRFTNKVKENTEDPGCVSRSELSSTEQTGSDKNFDRKSPFLDQVLL